MEYEPPHIPMKQSGQLSDGWRTVAFITWVLTGASTVAIAITSRTIGRPIWWLGSESNPAPIFYVLLPLVAVALPLFAASRKPARLPLVSIACSGVLGLSAVLDVSSSPAVALAAGVISLASFAISIALVAVARQYR